jgi:hypothetical protein
MTTGSVIPEAWLDQLGRIRDEVILLHHHRQIWSEMNATLAVGCPDEGTFLDHYDRLYADRQVVAVRRLIDRDKDTDSLAQLVNKLASRPDLLSRDRWVDLFRDGGAHWMTEAHRQFDRTADPSNPDRVDPQVMAMFAASLRDNLTMVKAYVDKDIAHMERSSTPTPLITWDQLDEAIDLLGEVVTKVGVMLTANWLTFTAGVIQTDWRRPFRSALFPSVGLAG